LLVGYDHRFGHNREEGFEDYCRYASQCGMEVLQVPSNKQYAMTNTLSVSSSSIRRCLSEGNIATANAMLGYRYRLTGKVVSGAKIGRTLGFPTANIVLNDKTKMLPKNGSYAVTVEETKRGLLYIGSRPTIEDEAGQNSNNGTSIEVHIIDFDGDLYGQTLTVEFVAFIRDEMKFDSPEALKQQIAADMVETLHATSPRTP
jgi:riboflavin kinase/FMN adenylyltransferase